MKLQLALDRITLEEALNIIEQTRKYVDIIEIGTSLIKDFGMQSIRTIRKAFPDTLLLADIKTIDEAEYEFRAVYEAGADIATVMGASALSSIAICDSIAKEYKKEYMIDLLEADKERIRKLTVFKDAIFEVHLPADKDGIGLDRLIKDSMVALGNVQKIAVAGGVSKSTIPLLKEYGVGIAIVGGAITKTIDKEKAVRQLRSIVGGYYD